MDDGVDVFTHVGDAGVLSGGDLQRVLPDMFYGKFLGLKGQVQKQEQWQERKFHRTKIVFFA
jgi:hypothetical protein